jgi:pimeloyl-ACP methyl ester carboxylesterase
MCAAASMRTLSHGKVDLALHQLRTGSESDRVLLLLHGLGESSPTEAPPYVDGWDGAVWALDFTGHGRSTVPAGGGYTCETLMSDVDAALVELGSATLLGRGLGAYVALLIAGARPALMRGAILADGPGITGGSPTATSPFVITAPPWPYDAPDPLAIAELTRDVRPPDYATSFARQATHLSGLGTPITVAATARPPWLAAVVEEPGVQQLPLTDAVVYYARIAD